jgi:hypothetical protein
LIHGCANGWQAPDAQTIGREAAWLTDWYVGTFGGCVHLGPFDTLFQSNAVAAEYDEQSGRW